MQPRQGAEGAADRQRIPGVNVKVPQAAVQRDQPAAQAQLHTVSVQADFAQAALGAAHRQGCDEAVANGNAAVGIKPMRCVQRDWGVKNQLQPLHVSSCPCHEPVEKGAGVPHEALLPLLEVLLLLLLVPSFQLWSLGLDAHLNVAQERGAPDEVAPAVADQGRGTEPAVQCIGQ